MWEQFGHHLSEEQWAQYHRDGFVKLGRVLNDDALEALQNRIDAIMLGEADLDYDRLLMQLDSDSGRYADAPPQTMGYKGATLDYRKIECLEYDPLFLDFVQAPLFREICARVYGAHIPINCFRAMFMNKPAGKGTFLPWHQDRWNNLDRDPLIAVWTALDPATRENGCVQIIRGSHRWGVVNPGHGSGFLSDEQASQYAPTEEIVFCEMEAGEAILLHNWLLHASDVNGSAVSRRAFSVCYMDGRTTNESDAAVGSRVFGDGALDAQTLRDARAARVLAA